MFLSVLFSPPFSPYKNEQKFESSAYFDETIQNMCKFSDSEQVIFEYYLSVHCPKI